MNSVLRCLCRQFVLGIFALATAAAANLEAEDTKKGLSDLSEDDFKSLAEKTNLYVKALNAASNIRRSYERYDSWVDLQKGPTGRERLIYGLYEINSSPVNDMVAAATRGPTLRPALPAVDDAVTKLAGATKTLVPLIKAASDYYEQEDYKDDNAKRGQELHGQMMPLFGQVFAAETALRRGIDAVKGEVDRRHLAQIEKTSGKNYEWHLRNFMLNAKGLVDLVPETPDAPTIDGSSYKARYADLETAYNAFMTYGEEHPDEVKKVLMASFVETALKDFFAASKFLRRVLDSSKPVKSDYVQKVNDLVEKYNTLIQRTNSLR